MIFYWIRYLLKIYLENLFTYRYSKIIYLRTDLRNIKKQFRSLITSQIHVLRLLHSLDVFHHPFQILTDLFTPLYVSPHTNQPFDVKHFYNNTNAKNCDSIDWKPLTFIHHAPKMYLKNTKKWRKSYQAQTLLVIY